MIWQAAVHMWQQLSLSAAGSVRSPLPAGVAAPLLKTASSGLGGVRAHLPGQWCTLVVLQPACQAAAGHELIHQQAAAGAGAHQRQQVGVVQAAQHPCLAFKAGGRPALAQRGGAQPLHCDGDAVQRAPVHGAKGALAQLVGLSKVLEGA